MERELGWWRKYVFSTDHKIIGLQYAISGFVFLLFGFCLMMLMRWQLAYPGKPLPIIGRLFGLNLSHKAPEVAEKNPFNRINLFSTFSVPR
jgi:heme/copper-type cytochrome/quinol oxidase subunit 1